MTGQQATAEYTINHGAFTYTYTKNTEPGEDLTWWYVTVSEPVTGLSLNYALDDSPFETTIDFNKEYSYAYMKIPEEVIEQLKTLLN